MSFLESRQQLAPQGIGKPVRRREDARFLTGAGKYADEVSLPGQAILGVTAVVESGKAVKATFWARLIRKARHGAQASGTEGSTPTPSRALAQNGCLRWNAKTFTPADKRASLETEAYFPRGTEISNPVPSSGESTNFRFLSRRPLFD
jgi:hypothetical protein